MAKMGQIWQNHKKWPKIKLINKGTMRKNSFECLILGKKLTCVKFSGAFDGIIEST